VPCSRLQHPLRLAARTAAALAPLLLGACAPHLERPELSIAGVQLVSTTVWEQHLRVRLRVHNSTPRLPAVLSPADYGHGLQNVELRLRAAYGGDAHLRVAPDPQGGTTAYLDLPHREFAGAARAARAAP